MSLVAAGVTALIGITAFAHSQTIVWQTPSTINANGVAFAPNGSFILASSGLNVLRINPANGQTTNTFPTPLATTIRGLAISPDSSRYAVAYGTGANARVGIYNASDGAQIVEINPGVGTVQRVGWNPAGTRFAVSGATGSAGIPIYIDGDWAAPTIVLSDPVTPITSTIRSFAWRNDTSLGAVVSAAPPRFRMWNTTDGTLTSSVTYGLAGQWGTAVSFQGTTHAVVAADNIPAPAEVARIDLSTNTVVATGSAPQTWVDGGVINTGALSGTSIVVGASRTLIHNTDFSAVGDFTLPGSIVMMAVNPSGAGFVTATNAGLRLYSLPTPPTSAPPTQTWQTPGGLPTSPLDITVSPNGMYLATGQGTGANIIVFNSATGSVLWTASLTGTGPWARGLDFSPDSSRLMVSNWPSTNGQLDFYDSADGGNLTTILVTGQPNVRAGKWISSTLVAVAQVTPRIVAVYDVTSSSLVAQSAPLGAGGSIFGLDVSPDGTRIAAGTTGGSNTGVYVLDATSLVVLSQYTDGSLANNWLSWRGNTILAGNGNNLWAFDAGNVPAGPTTIFNGASTINALRLSPDGTHAAVGNLQGLTIVRVADSTVVESYPVFDSVTAVNYFPDNSRIALGRSTGQIVVIENPVAPSFGSTVFWQGPNSGPLPRLVVAWRTSNTVVTLPTVTIDIPVGAWDVRAIGSVNSSPEDGIVWQNTDPAFSMPGLVALWSIDSNGTPTSIGMLGAPTSFDWVLCGFADINGSGSSDALFHNVSNGTLVAWLRDGAGNVVSTPVVGTVPSGWTPIVAGTMGAGNTKLFFQQGSTSTVVMWTIDAAAMVTDTMTVGVPGSGWQLVGLGSFQAGSPALLFQNDSNPTLFFWNIDSNGNVTGSGSLSEDRPAGWSVVGVGRL